MGVLKAGKRVLTRVQNRSASPLWKKLADNIHLPDWGMFHMHGIQKRWMVNNLGMVSLILLLVVATFSFLIGSNYYASVGATLVTRAEVDAGGISMYQTRAEFVRAAKEYVSTFKDSARIELQFLTTAGRVDRSSYSLTTAAGGGTPAGSMADTPDVGRAKENKRIETYLGTNPQTGERILSVTSPLLYGGEAVGMLRYITSLRLVDRQVLFTCGVSIAVAAVIIAMIYFSNLFFVRSIVDPLVEITQIAKRIAGGSYGIQAEYRNRERSDDEIGALTDAINEMSSSIRRAENMKSEFMSSVSHELRTPLTAINGWAETIMGGETRDEMDVRKGMGIIASEAKRLTSMVEELLEFSRMEDGRFTLSVEPMDIKAELEDAVYTYREFFAREGIALTHFDCEEEFPPLSGDPSRLRQVFCNLLDNAAKHGGSGKRIDTAIFSDGGDVVITLRDYGPGIPEAELPHVKLKFYKGSSTARGSGIGLAVCEEIITRHNGSFTIENATDGGCLVTVQLPIGTQV
jgi:signal transduction histidine kinase